MPNNVSRQRWTCPNCGAYLGSYDLQAGSSFERVCHHCKAICILAVEGGGRIVERCLMTRARREQDCRAGETLIAWS